MAKSLRHDATHDTATPIAIYDPTSKQWKVGGVKTTRSDMVELVNVTKGGPKSKLARAFRHVH